MPSILTVSFPKPRILLLWFAEKRTAFAHRVEAVNDWVLLGAQAGEFLYGLGEPARHSCRPGDFVLCPPGVPLFRTVTRPLDFMTIRFRWKPTEPGVWQGRWTLRDGVRYQSTLDALRSCREGEHPHALAAWANHLLTDLLFQLAHDVRQASLTARAAPDRPMLRVAERMRRDLAAPLSLADLAHELSLDPYQFSRRFRAAFGIAPGRYRTRLRIQEARRLLLETDWTTERIAQACGFENAFYFSRVFRKEIGQPPRDYRREHRL